MRNIFTQIEIAAPAERIWAILMDYPDYPTWNPFLRRIIASEANGELTITVEPAKGISLRVRVEPEAVDPGYRLKWHGFYLHERLIRWDHQLELEKHGANCIVRQTERLSGMTVFILPNSMIDPIRFGFARMNKALRDHAEVLQRASG